MFDNVVWQSIIIIALFTLGGVAGALLMRFIANLTAKARENDDAIAEMRSIKTRIYQVAADSLKAMRLAQSVELYKLNYRAFQEAMVDAEVVKLDSKGIWRALYVRSTLPTPRSNTLPNEDQKELLLEAEEELYESMKELIEEQDQGPKKKKRKKKGK